MYLALFPIFFVSRYETGSAGEGGCIAMRKEANPELEKEVVTFRFHYLYLTHSYPRIS